MPTAAVPASSLPNPLLSPMAAAADSCSKDAVVAWFRGEFAASNAIIDALCGHLAEFAGCGPGSEYESVFAAIHGRRTNWIPVLQMQSYHSIADVLLELRKVTERKKAAAEAADYDSIRKKSEENCASVISGDDCIETIEDKGSPHSVITDSGSVEAEQSQPTAKLCGNHEDCSGRNSQIKLTKGFNAKEHIKGHMVNVVKGLKVYDGIFTDSELLKLSDLVNELRVAGQNEQLSGETYISFNKQMKGNRRELVQFGVPIFEHVSDDSSQNELEPIPDLLQDVIDHLIQWQLIPEYKRPNGAIIHYFDEDEYSQPFLKPPHLEQPISTLVLSDATMAFGRALVSDSEGNYKGPLMLSLKQGSMLVMRGNSADLARHVLCPSASKRVCITFFRVRQACPVPASPPSQALALWQGSPMAMEMVPMVMVTCPMKVPQGGTGVFLPWAVGQRSATKRLPPRAQRMRLQPVSESESKAKAVVG